MIVLRLENPSVPGKRAKKGEKSKMPVAYQPKGTKRMAWAQNSMHKRYITLT